MIISAHRLPLPLQDLSSKDLKRDLYIVAHVVRTGTSIGLTGCSSHVSGASRHARVPSRAARRSHAAQRLQEGPASRAVPTALRLRRPGHERRVPHHHGPQGGEGLCAESLHVSERQALAVQNHQTGKTNTFLNKPSVCFSLLWG